MEFNYYQLPVVAAVARGDRIHIVIRRIRPNTLVTRFRTRRVRGAGRVVTQADVWLLLVFKFKVAQTI